MGLAVATSVSEKTKSDAVEEMAPALTEPLSQSKLSSSAASGASPRTSSSTATTAAETLGETTIITSADNFHTEVQQPVELEPDQEHVYSTAQHNPSSGEVTDATETITTACTTAILHEGGALSEGELLAPGTATMSLSVPRTDAVGTTTVDDIQNNNGGDQGLKLDADASRDLIELALEHLHHENTVGGGHSAEGSEIPAMEGIVESNVVDMNPAAPASNVLHPQTQPTHGDLMALELPSGQVIMPPGSFPDTQLLQQPQQQQPHLPLVQQPQHSQHPQQLQVPSTAGGILTMPVTESSLSSSSLAGGVGVSGTNEMGMQLKESPEMDQMIRELSTAADIDLLQVFKSFDNNSLLLFSDVDVANLCDVPVSDGSQSQTSPNKDRERLEQHAEIVKLQAQMQRKQDFLGRRLSKLMTRYMGQHVSEEIAGLFEFSQRFWKKREKENAKLIHNANINTSGNSAGAIGAHFGNSLTGETGSCWPDIIPFQAPPPDQTPEKLKPISANALKTFAKRLECLSNTVCSVQSKRVLNSPHFHGVSGGRSAIVALSSSRVSAVPSASSGGNVTGMDSHPFGGNIADGSDGANISNTIPLFDRSATQELEQTAGMLYAELRQVQGTIDSDATLSSSGGESADESMPYTNALQQPLAITKRAAWKWANDRASVASKWTWMVARIADLEYRIRQHNEVLNKIRINKGPVTLEESLASSGQLQSPTVNGYRGPLPGSSKPLTSEGGVTPVEEEDADGCSRTKPYCRSRFRKRKLLQTHNLHTVSKRAAKCSNIKCGCQWPLMPCALCTGRTDPTAPRDPLDTMTYSERIALLDASYHPVLSFDEDISHSIHMEAIMRSPEWQDKMLHSTATTVSTPSEPASGPSRGHHQSAGFFSSGDDVGTSSHGKRYISSDGKRKQCALTSSKYKNNDRSLSDPVNKSKKAKSKRDGVPPNNRKSGKGNNPPDCHRTGTNGHRNKNPQATSKSRKSSQNCEYYYGNDTNVSRSKNSSPTPNNRSERRHRNNSSYDIGSIVMPQSMAASTRVSLPQYKDIAIPKWCIVDDNDDTAEVKSSTMSTVDAAMRTSDNSTVAKGTEPLSVGVDDKMGMINPPAKLVTSNAPNGAKTVASVVIPSTSGYGENTQQQLIVIPAQDEEDVSEEAMMLKHDRALQEERKKFRSYLKFPWSRPRGKRRTESRAGSSGGNTPDPTSPAPPTPMVDHDSSPACPSTPLTPQDGQELSETNVINALNKSLNKKERRRTVSSKREEQQTQGNVIQDARVVVSPYEPLEFPLADGTFDKMLRAMPSDHITLADDCLSKLTGRNGQPFRRPPYRNNNVLLRAKSCVNLAPASLGLGNQNPLSSNASSTTTLSATETDLEDFDDEDLMLAKRTENQLIMERLLNSRSESQQYEIVPPSAKPMLDDDEAIDDEETDTGESLFVEEDDPNDPEWNDRPAGRSGGGGGGGPSGAGCSRA